jgi:antitoxin component YwqK of YwqJK toxin-antitoxin module
MEGLWLDFYESGKPKEEIHYLASQKHGRNRRFEEGWLYEEGSWVNGQKEGTWTKYYRNGKVRSLDPLVHGVTVGTSVGYNEEGQKYVEFIHGTDGRVMEWTYFGSDGRWTQKCRGEAIQPHCIRPGESWPP